MVKTFTSFVSFSVKSGASILNVMMDVYIWDKDLHYVWRNQKS